MIPAFTMLGVIGSALISALAVVVVQRRTRSEREAGVDQTVVETSTVVLNSLRADYDRVRADVDTLRGEIRSLRVQLLEVTATRDDVVIQLIAAKKENAELRARVEHLEEQADRNERELASYRQQQKDGQ